MTVCSINIAVPTSDTDKYYKSVVLNILPIVIMMDGDEDPITLIKQHRLESWEQIESAVRENIKTPLLWNKAILQMRTVWDNGKSTDAAVNVVDLFGNKQ